MPLVRRRCAQEGPRRRVRAAQTWLVKNGPSHLYLPPMSRVTFCYLTSWRSGDEQHASGVLESVSSGRHVLVMWQETGSICLHRNKFNQSFTLLGI